MRPFLVIALVCALAAVLIGSSARAQVVPVEVEIERQFLGSGEPGLEGFENATLVVNDVYHAPQYLPGWPTAAPIWARVVDVACVRTAAGGLRCKGYNWQPAMGRGEYLYFRPVLVDRPPA